MDSESLLSEGGAIMAALQNRAPEDDVDKE